MKVSIKNIKTEYRSSGVDWLGNIPVGWNLVPTRSLFKTKKQLVGAEAEKHLLLGLTLSGVKPRDLSLGGKNPADYDSYQIFEPGELVMCLFDYDVTPRTVGYLKQKGMMTGAYTRLIPRINLDARYYYYLFLYFDEKKELLYLCTGLRNSISKYVFWSLQNPQPPVETQKRIADFLDKKTKVIDDLVAKRGELIELLREKRTALITRAVTKGLDFNTKLKPSGVEWLGDIPVGWEIWKLKHLARRPIKNGIGESAEYTEETWPRYIRITDIESPRSLRPDTFRSLPNDIAINAPVYYGDLLMAAVGGTFGRAYLHLQNAREYCYAGYLVRFSPNKKVLPSFAGYWTESAIYWNQLRANVIQATIQNFSAAKYKELLFLLPHLEIQKQIVFFLDAETTKIDRAVALIGAQIEKLKEYRSSLIYHAVTGKIKV